jgi:hypothetical protein
MQTYVIDCKKLTFDVSQRDVLAIYIKFANRSRGYLVLLRSPQKGHRVIFSKFAVARRFSAIEAAAARGS